MAAFTRHVRQLEQSTGRFELFRDFQNIGHGVPVAAGGGRLQNLVDTGPREPGLARAIRKINIEFAADGVEFFRGELLLKHRFAGLGARIGNEKKDVQFVGLDVGALGERIFLDDCAEVVGGPQDDLGVAAEFLCDGGLDAFRGDVEIAFAGLEDYVAALQVSSCTFKFERGVECAKSFHFDFAVAPNVDGAKHGDEDWHR